MGEVEDYVNESPHQHIGGDRAQGLGPVRLPMSAAQIVQRHVADVGQLIVEQQQRGAGDHQRQPS